MIFLIILSVCSTVLNNALRNYVGKKFSGTSDAVKNFQLYSFLICLFFFAVFACFGSFSWFTLLLGLLFGIMIYVSTHFQILALSNGPMHITVLVTTASMLIPTLSGCLFFQESFSGYKFAVVFLLIGFLYLASAKKRGEKFNKKWVLFCVLSFFGTGLVGVLQKVHQTSAYRNEFYLFLASAFLVSILMTVLEKKKEQTAEKLPKMLYVGALVSGVCVFAMYAINTKLSGVLPSQLFFPLINGSNVVFSSVVSCLVFKEKMSTNQLIGVGGALLSLILICVLP